MICMLSQEDKEEFAFCSVFFSTCLKIEANNSDPNLLALDHKLVLMVD